MNIFAVCMKLHRTLSKSHCKRFCVFQFSVSLVDKVPHQRDIWEERPKLVLAGVELCSCVALSSISAQDHYKLRWNVCLIMTNI